MRRQMMALYYQHGWSLTRIARKFGVCQRSVSYHVGKARYYGQTCRIRYNSTLYQEGRRRLAMIREAVRMQMIDEMNTSAIGRKLGMGASGTRKLLHTPFADALRRYVFGSGGLGTEGKLEHTLAMSRQGCDAGHIARTLDLPKDQVEHWIMREPT